MFHARYCKLHQDYVAQHKFIMHIQHKLGDKLMVAIEQEQPPRFIIKQQRTVARYICFDIPRFIWPSGKQSRFMWTSILPWLFGVIQSLMSTCIKNGCPVYKSNIEVYYKGIWAVATVILAGIEGVIPYSRLYAGQLSAVQWIGQDNVLEMSG